MVVLSRFEKDFREAVQLFPKLSFRKAIKEREKVWVVEGELDICDQIGQYWGTFEVAIYLPASYPYCTPKVKELSKQIRRDDDWHIDNNGICCLDIEHRMLQMQMTGVNLTSFIKNKVYPYFANHIFKQNEGHYAAGEFKHSFEGVVQFYREDLNIETPELAVGVLKGIMSKTLPLRNEPCLCNTKKYKNCHMQSVEFLRSLPVDRLEKDLEEFKKLLS